MTDKRPLFIITNNRSGAIRSLFGGQVPGWARVLGAVEDLQTLQRGDAAFGVWYGPRDFEHRKRMEEAWVLARKRCWPLGVGAERLNKFRLWRADKGLPPCPELEILTDADMRDAVFNEGVV